MPAACNSTRLAFFLARKQPRCKRSCVELFAVKTAPNADRFFEKSQSRLLVISRLDFSFQPF
jgi:hypothetical protein